MDLREFDPPPRQRRPVEPGAHRLAVIGILAAASPVALALAGYALTPDGDGFGRLAGLAWGTVAAAPAGVLAIILGVTAVRRGSAVGYLTILSGCPGLITLPSLVRTLTTLTGG